MGKYSLENLLKFSDRGASSLATSLLDEIVSKAEVDEQVPLYVMANYKKSGQLVEKYLLEGQKELEDMASNDIKKFMYRDGEGDVLDQGKDEQEKGRKVCWKLDHRGMLGESLLHVLVLCNTDVHTQIAMFLVDMYPSLAHDIVEGEEYYGATAMHFAIAYENSKLMKKLVECGANVHQRANGKFFLPIDQQWPIPRAKTNFEGLSYFGEYPLAWAACCDDESSYNLLLKHGADPNLQDTYGNNILHVLVIRDKLKMYGYALRHPSKPASDRLCNKFGLTPLTLACKLGRNTIFREMLEFSSLEFWRYSNITCSGYPLNALDSLQPDGRANLNSALMIILKGNSTEHLDMLEGGVIQRLLEEKWKTFAQRYFYIRLLMMLIHLLFLSIAVFLRPTTREPLLGGTDASTIVRYCAEVATCIGCVMFGIVQQVQEILAQGLSGFLYSLTTSPTKSAFLLSCFLILCCIPCRVVHDRETEDVLLCLAIPGSWFYLIFFAGAVRLTGPFVTMIYSMLVGDMFRFSIIYVIFLCGFTQAFFFLFKTPPSEERSRSKRFSSFPVTWMGLFHMTLGSYEYEEFRETYYQKLTQLVFAMFMVFTPILLLNMLIAMMGNTYCEVITQSEKEWVKQWANIIVALERSIDIKSAREFVQTYSIKMPSSEKDAEIRGVVVIKSKPKSKAKEKKQALGLWKRVGKRTIQELRRVGGSAADVRKRYNLFRSKQPTARLRNGKIVLEWNPAPTPVYAQAPTAPPAPPGSKKSAMNGDFNELLSQVTSASGIDIAKPITKDDSTSKDSPAEQVEVKKDNDLSQTLPSHANLNVPTSVNMGSVYQPDQNTAVYQAGQNAAVHHGGSSQNAAVYPDGQNNTIYPTRQNTAIYPTFQNTAVYQAGQNTTVHQGTQNTVLYQAEQNTAVYPTGQNTAVYPTRQNTAVYPTGQNTAVYPTGQNTAVYPTGQNTAVYPTGQNTAVYPTGQNTAVYPTGQNTAVYPTGQNTAVYPTGQNTAVYPTGQSTAVYPTGQNTVVYPSGQNTAGYQHQAELPQYTACVQGPAAYTNLAFEGDNNVANINPNFHQGMEANLPADESKTSGNVLNYVNDHNSQEVAYHEMSSHPNFGDYGAQASQQQDDQGISFNVQTRIISTKITKVHVPRNKDQQMLGIRQGASASSSDNETRKGKKKKGNGKVYNFPYRAKHKKRRKRNQVSFEERITVDTHPCNFPVLMETTIQKSDPNMPTPKAEQYPLFYPKIEDEQ